MNKVDLKKIPYNLSDKEIEWVESTIKNMSLEEKIRQLFFVLTSSKDENYLKDLASSIKMGGARYNPMSALDTYKHNKVLQENSKIPLLIAANCESGGNGAVREGTEIGCGTKVGSTHDLSLAYKMGYYGAYEAKQVGVNVLFAPIVDIHHDFHNPVISYKTFGSDPELVKNMSLEFFKGVKDNNLIACAKHFPGDGYDERDQHLSRVRNPLSCKEWDESFGKVYQSLIDTGLPMIMAGHIDLESYERKFNPNLKEVLPASASKELITDLLKTQMNFNGLVVTDATHMVGLTSSMKRSEFLPQIIASGCDMILFYNDPDEDFTYMMDGYNNKVFDDDRLNDALRRILGIKCILRLNEKRDLFEGLDISKIGSEEAKNAAKEVTKKGITLVKNEEKIFPLNKEKIKRILIVPQKDENPFEAMMPKRGPTIFEYFASKLVEEGFEVEIFESLMDKAKKASPMEAFQIVGNIYNNKTPIKQLTDNYDLIIQVLDFDSHNTVTRVLWKMSKGTADIPWYVNEIPTIMISLRYPFHLFDAPQMKTYINCYDKNHHTIDSLVNKMVGKEEFLGKSSVDAYCGMKHN